MFVRIDSAAQFVDSGQHRGARFGRDHFDESRTDELIARPVPEAAVGVVDEGQRGIRQEPADQFALRVDDAAVADFAAARLFFRAPAPDPLRQEADDERDLRGEHHHAADHISPVVLEERTRLMEDEAAGRHETLIDVPALQLPPVEHPGMGRLARRNVVCRRSGEDLFRHRRHPPGIVLEPPHIAADDASTEVFLLQGEDGSGGHAEDLREAFEGIQVLRLVADRLADEEHDRVLRDGAHLLEELVERQIAEVGHLEPVARGHLALDLGLDFPGVVSGPIDDHQVAGHRPQGQREIDIPTNPAAALESGDVVRGGRKLARSRRVADNCRASEDGAIRAGEVESPGAHDGQHVDGATGVLLLEIAGDQSRLIGGAEALGLDCLLIDVDRHRRLGSYGVHEGGVEPGPKRPAAQLLVEQQDALHGRGGWLGGGDAGGHADPGTQHGANDRRPCRCSQSPSCNAHSSADRRRFQRSPRCRGAPQATAGASRVNVRQCTPGNGTVRDASWQGLLD